MKQGSQYDGIAADVATRQVVTALRRIIRAIDLHSRALVNRYGLTGPQLTLLRELVGEGELAVGELAKAIHLSQATVTGILDRLVQRGLVRRRQGDRDRRRVLVHLTQEGREMLARTPPLLQEHFTAQFAKLADWEQTQILSSLQRVVAMMEATDLDATPILTTGPMDATTARVRAFLGQSCPVPDAAVCEPLQPLPGQGDRTEPDRRTDAGRTQKGAT
jgi:DNA-binding MarR family transcriptional regulator